MALALPAAGCGGDDTGQGADRPTVYAASSLRAALPELLPDARYAFGGSNQLRLQIERGAPADVLIAASPKDPRALAAAGRCTTPVPIASNELVLIVPRDARDPVRGIARLRRGGLRLAVGAAGVPIGDYTRKLLRTAGAQAVLTRNTVSSEPSVASINAKVRLGSADAGFVYVTDARADGDAVRVVRLPRALQPVVRYAGCAVRRGGRPAAAAETYLARLRSPAVQRRLRARGFGPPPAATTR